MIKRTIVLLYTSKKFLKKVKDRVYLLSKVHHKKERKKKERNVSDDPVVLGVDPFTRFLKTITGVGS